MEKLRPTGVKLRVEKVETVEEYDALAEFGFDYFQGYFLSKRKLMRSERLSSTSYSVLHHTESAGQALSDTLSNETCEYPDVQFLNRGELDIRDAFIAASEWSFNITEQFRGLSAEQYTA